MKQLEMFLCLTDTVANQFYILINSPVQFISIRYIKINFQLRKANFLRDCSIIKKACGHLALCGQAATQPHLGGCGSWVAGGVSPPTLRRRRRPQVPALYQRGVQPPAPGTGLPPAGTGLPQWRTHQRHQGGRARERSSCLNMKI